jgi:hypothetical protein
MRGSRHNPPRWTPRDTPQSLRTQGAGRAAAACDAAEATEIDDCSSAGRPAAGKALAARLGAILASNVASAIPRHEASRPSSVTLPRLRDPRQAEARGQPAPRTDPQAIGSADARGNRRRGPVIGKGVDQPRSVRHSTTSPGPAFISRRAYRWPGWRTRLARQARKATASTPRRRSMRLVLARRPNPASSGAAAAPPVGSVLVSDNLGSAIASRSTSPLVGERPGGVSGLGGGA